MPKTILSVVSTLARCGPVHVLMGVLGHLDPSRYRAVVATLSAEPADSLMGEFISRGVCIKQLRLSRAQSLISGASRLRRLVSELKPGLVHCHGLRADVLTARARLRCPLLSTLHCDLAEDYRLAFGRSLGALLTARQYAALQSFDGVIAVSESVAEAAQRQGIAARVISNGVELNKYFPASGLSQKKALRARFGWEPDDVIVLHTAILAKRKNPVDVVRGFLASTLASRGLLVFAGDGPLEAACKRAAGSAARVVFLGKRRDVPDLLRAADILISASSSEGLPMALLEGCASGIRVLATDIAPHRSIQNLFSDQMQIFARGNSDDVREALDSLEPARLHQSFLPYPSVLEMISTRRMSNQYQEFYDGILESSSCAVRNSERMALCQ